MASASTSSSPSTEAHEHNFTYSIKDEKCEIVCRTPCTLLEALMTSEVFKATHIQKTKITGKNKENKEQKTKEILIQRGQPPSIAVTSHFPCQLINKNEHLTIQYIQGQHINPPDMSQTVKSEELVTFKIQTQGGKNITRKIIKNTNIPSKELCVYAYKGETVKDALKRDARFADDVFHKNCWLNDVNSGSTVEMSRVVDRKLHDRLFQIQKIHGGAIPKSKKSDTDNSTSKALVSNVKIEGPECNNNADGLTSSHDAKDVIKRVREKLKISVPETEQEQSYLEKLLEEGLKSACSEFQKVSKLLKKQKDIWKVFREEYDKSAQSCSEVHIVKTLMTLADSVCKIRINGVAMGTGFILFHIPAENPESSNSQTHRRSFILTNAHVVMAAVESSGRKLFDGITLTAEFEEWKDDKKKLNSRHVKKELVAGVYRPADHLDFALLELEDSEEWQLPDGLLTRYRPSPPRGGICLIGHPDGGDKKMDPSFIVEPQNQFNSVMRHIIKNKELQPFMQKKCLEESWTFDSSTITYNSCFFYGSSGSPVFDSFCNLIGIHSGGYSYTGHEGETKSIIEYAYPLEATFKCIVEQSAERGRIDVSEYIQSQLNILAVNQENQSQTLIPGLDNETFRESILDTKPEDEGTSETEPMDSS